MRYVTKSQHVTEIVGSSIRSSHPFIPSIVGPSHASRQQSEPNDAIRRHQTLSQQSEDADRPVISIE
jgi:hypothetical protein